ncbi:MAG: maleylpyruvate isomerase N-terminal domain-containing protein, partial [Actinomycetota bacterium]
MTAGAAADPWALYAGSRDRFIELVRSLSADELDRTIPLTPGWTVTQALAHVCGLNGDLASGLREGLGAAERTAHQVDSRAELTAAEICEEWLGHGDTVKAIIDEHGFLGRRLAADLVIHLHDVQHALGRPIDTEDDVPVDAG